MHILIVGGGLGGLTAALCLSRSRENTVELLELRPDLSPAGGGLQVRPPASRLLHAWGLRGDLARAAEDTSAAVYRDLGTGEVATRAVAAREEGAGVDWGVRRRDLVALLYGKIKGEERVKVRFGACAVGVRDGDGDGGRAAVRVREGDRGHESEVQVEADLVLVADGIRSRLRAQVLQDLEGDFEPLLSELTLYGVDLPLGAAELRANPALRPLAAQGATHLNVYLGRGLWVVTRHYPKLGRQSLLFGVRGATDQTGLWDEKGDLGAQGSARECPGVRSLEVGGDAGAAEVDE
ncbi:hypothetical protein F4810DRAFT_709286 [Camillea tinctor]|nr:hypothetical protein F4810DRAFT_709286 [Camillea tinctor]